MGDSSVEHHLGIYIALRGTRALTSVDEIGAHSIGHMPSDHLQNSQAHEKVASTMARQCVRPRIFLSYKLPFFVFFLFDFFLCSELVAVSGDDLIS